MVQTNAPGIAADTGRFEGLSAGCAQRMQAYERKAHPGAQKKNRNMVLSGIIDHHRRIVHTQCYGLIKIECIH
jgi:hypothetical protein